jgi:hypothetical protein
MDGEEAGLSTVGVAGEGNDNKDFSRWWHSIFREEIELAREVRNTVGHRPLATGTGELKEASQVARVLSILFGGLGIETTQIDRFERQLGAGG